MVFHRVGHFLPDGTCAGPGFTAVLWDWAIPTPGAFTFSQPANGPAPAASVQTYVLPMEDLAAHWLRLHCEYVHPDGDHTLLRHRGGQVHPTLAHVQLGGVLTWAAPPHPGVTALMAQLGALDTRGWLLRCVGPAEGL